MISVNTKSLCLDFAVSVEEAKDLSKITYPNKSIKSISRYDDASSTSAFLYLVEFDEGWAMLAGDKRVNPFLAYEPQSPFEDNKVDQCWFGNLLEHERNLKGEEVFPLWKRMSRTKTELLDVSTKCEVTSGYMVKHRIGSWLNSDEDTFLIPHLTSTNWHQHHPFNVKCPLGWDSASRGWGTSLVGCSGVAVGQLLYYCHNELGTPSGFYHTVIMENHCRSRRNNYVLRRSDFVANSLRWSDMPQDEFGFNTEYVADLLVLVADGLGTHFGVGHSGAYPSQETMNFWGLEFTEGDFSYTLVKNNLSERMPVIIVAFNRDDSSDGHTWLIDGMVTNRKSYTTRYEWQYYSTYDLIEIEPYDEIYTMEEVHDLDWEDNDWEEPFPGQIVDEVDMVTSNYLYMNWGWADYYGWNTRYAFAARTSTDWEGYTDIYGIYYDVRVH